MRFFQNEKKRRIRQIKLNERRPVSIKSYPLSFGETNIEFTSKLEFVNSVQGRFCARLLAIDSEYKVK